MKPHQPRPAPWHRILASAAQEISRQFGPIDRPTAERIGRQLRALIVPRRAPGRKPTKAVRAAAELKRQGLSWQKIYSQVFDPFDMMPWHERNWRCYNLRRAVGSLERRRRRKARRDRGPHDSGEAEREASHGPDAKQ